MRSLPRTIRPLVLGVAFALGLSALTALPAQAHGQVTAQGVVVTADPADWTPQIQDGQVNAIVQIGTKVVVGGTFTTVRKANTSLNVTRNFIFAFDMNTGTIDPNFVPQLNDAVLALAPGPDGTSVYVGGEFGTVNGVTYRHLALLNLADGTPVASFQRERGPAGPGHRAQQRLALCLGQVLADRRACSVWPGSARSHDRHGGYEPRPAVHRPIERDAWRP